MQKSNHLEEDDTEEEVEIQDDPGLDDPDASDELEEPEDYQREDYPSPDSAWTEEEEEQGSRSVDDVAGCRWNQRADGGLETFTNWHAEAYGTEDDNSW
jgi:hypothetical protein